MAITIEIPTAFRRFTDGSPKYSCSATTVAEALNVLTFAIPWLGKTCSRRSRPDPPVPERVSQRKKISASSAAKLAN